MTDNLPKGGNAPTHLNDPNIEERLRRAREALGNMPPREVIDEAVATIVRIEKEREEAEERAVRRAKLTASMMRRRDGS